MNSVSQTALAAWGPATPAIPLPDLLLLIGGSRVDAARGKSIAVDDPATGAITAHVPVGRAEDIDLAVQAARRTFESAAWRRMRPLDRVRIIESVALKIEDTRQ